jgi:putative phage-type endonuclease
MFYNDDDIETLLELIDIYYNETKHLQYMPEYKNILITDLHELLITDDDSDICELIECQVDYYYDINDIPEYSQFYYELDDDYNKVDEDIVNKIAELIKIPIIEQRTDEWLEIRHNMLSASNIYKAFKSPATIKSLINDKSSPLTNNTSYNPKGGLNNPMGWGILFEKVSVSIYEYIYNTKIGVFGCIKHPKLNFIGASPDGINISSGERFGRMLEIKNIYNRDITGIPKDEYWVQMQVQMEVCNLNYCDFLETRFCLYNTMEEFIKGDSIFRGVLLEINGEFNYYYLWDYGGYIDDFMLIINNEIAINSENNCYVYWWYLDELSCVLIKRNNDWFNAIFPYLNNTWNSIINARKNGCVKPRKKEEICLIKLEET